MWTVDHKNLRSRTDSGESESLSPANVSISFAFVIGNLTMEPRIDVKDFKNDLGESSPSRSAHIAQTQ